MNNPTENDEHHECNHDECKMPFKKRKVKLENLWPCPELQTFSINLIQLETEDKQTGLVIEFKACIKEIDKNPDNDSKIIRKNPTTMSLHFSMKDFYIFIGSLNIQGLILKRLYDKHDNPEDFFNEIPTEN